MWPPHRLEHIYIYIWNGRFFLSPPVSILSSLPLAPTPSQSTCCTRGDVTIRFATRLRQHICLSKRSRARVRTYVYTHTHTWARPPPGWRILISALRFSHRTAAATSIREMVDFSIFTRIPLVFHLLVRADFRLTIPRRFGARYWKCRVNSTGPPIHHYTRVYCVPFFFASIVSHNAFVRTFKEKPVVYFTLEGFRLWKAIYCSARR